MSKSNTSSSRPLLLLSRFGRDESGNYALITALLMPVLIGAAALGTEMGYWMQQQQEMQDAADSAAYAAAAYYGPNNTNSSGVTSAATSVASTYGFASSSGGGGTTLTAPKITVAEPPTDGPSKGQMGAVEVTIKKKYPRMLSAIFGNTPVAIAARAVAKTKGGYGCVLSLDPTTSNAAQAQGTINVALQSCSLYDDSNAGNAVSGG